MVAERPTWGPAQAPVETPQQTAEASVVNGPAPALPKPPGKMAVAWNRFLVFLHDLPDLMRRIADIFINIVVVGGAVVLVAVLSVVGDRLYLQYTNTGFSRLESALKQRGYNEEALAFRQQNDICEDERQSLDLCLKASWMYRHPEIIVWPDKTKTATALPATNIDSSR